MLQEMLMGVNSFINISKYAKKMKTEELHSGKGFNLRLEARLKNAYLVGARETLGMTPEVVADEIGIIYAQYFSEELRKRTSMKRKLIMEREIPPDYLLPYHQVEERLLPSVTGEIEKNLELQNLIRDINSVLSNLPYREEQILRAYFGIGAEEKDTLQLSQEYNISRQRIGQIKNKALAKLRRHPFRKILTPYLENSLLREH